MVVLALKAADHPSGITVLFEAMAMGKPVIASDIGTTRDYVVPGETGLLVPPGDAQALRQAVLDLHADPARRRRFGETARRRIEQEFSMPAFIDRFATSIRASVPPGGG
jgi:type III pantothenate kinase